jgi:hypothetical protein
VNNPVPTVASISPTTAYVGTTQPLVLTVNGTGFIPAPALPGAVGSRIKIGTRVTTDTTFVSSTRLTVPLTAADVATASTVAITVVNPPLGGGVSNSASLTVAADTTAPVTTITGADTAWHNVPVVLTVGATDAQSGVKTTQYQIDTGAPTAVVGGTITVPAPADGSGDGAQTVTAWSTDWCGNVEDPGPTVTVNIDVTGPQTVASVASSVKQGTKVTFGYRANDISPKCKITLKIKKGSSTQVKRSYSLGSKTSNKSLQYKVNPNLGKGTYKYYVYATDQAGNKQSELGQKTFKVK